MHLMSLSIENAVETLQTATEENQLSSLRQEQVVHLPAEGDVWMTGDLHDHRRNFDRLIAGADLAANPKRHLILHELIHGEHYDPEGADGSWQSLYRAAELKCDFPEQVHFLLANHDLAQIHGEGIMKSGMSVCEAFTAGVKRDFGSDYGKVILAITEFFLSFPLAVRCPNGLMFCHSLPSDDQIDGFDYTVLNRPLVGGDYRRRSGPVYQLIWGRNISPESATKFADRVNAKFLVTGHQPQDGGFAVNGPRHLIIASEHNQGVFLPVDLACDYPDMRALTRCLRRIGSLDL
jgi:hypothetical protein